MTLTFAFDPIIAQLGPFQLGWHGIFTALAVLVAVWLAGWLGQRRGISTDVIYGIAGWGVVGGIVGARLFHVLDHLPYYLDNPLLIPAVWEGGIAVYGAFIGGLVAGGVAAWRARLDPWPLLDIAAPAMLVGQAIGRLGCLSNGDAWGADATGCPFCLAIRYTNQNDLLPADLKGGPTYAYPLYEIGCEVVLLVGLWMFRDKFEKRPGLMFLVAAIGYAVIRFGLSYLRQEAIVVMGLQEAQVIAVITGGLALCLLVWRVMRVAAPVAPPATPA
jgi:phosphatidylglycerol---prolipoprotein diacylglyceryl transferase